MSDQVTITNMPESGSKHRVAFDLMAKIALREETPSAENARDYYLKLFTECRKIVF